ncbi:MAG: glycosyltransferase family 2 protein [Solirubrobacteraceae bacterium]
MQPRPTATIAIPTRARPAYLEVTLASVVPQAALADAEVLVVSDGAHAATTEVAHRHGVRLLSLPTRAGLNAARNAAVTAAGSDLIVFTDDDVVAPPDWLAAVLSGARGAPDRDVFGGPIRARLEGGGPRACGREPVPISTLELGAEDRDAPHVWGANMAIRARAFRLVGGFDEAISGRGDEEEWQRRYAARGGRIRYLAAAGLDHRRDVADSRLRVLARSAYGHGRAARRNDVRKGAAPAIAGELRTLAGCAWHVVRRRCANGVVLTVHAAGRLWESLGAWKAPGARRERSLGSRVTRRAQRRR